ncbi:hypothetical protein [Paracidobacterium acidisoli]|uniref:Uncharacterized protein n=1 Tax=Paracidobacterium acidisoli TaxID=2303751 RepID=A0A372IJY1_9BACT|nr:hypothetical protein [Paracidobacterium acidisoli]MBT9333071.1 hypothetical protein [Paracidobacterium acidisoli]
MISSLLEIEENVEPDKGMVREQLALLVEDHAFRSSKRSVAFLRYVVEQTLEGSAELLKERTIGIEVFGRDPSYDTSGDHVVRTAATELRKRLAIYYGDEKHRSELRIGLLPGSYIPQFTLPGGESAKASERAAAPRSALDEPSVVEPLPPAAAIAASARLPRKLLYAGIAAAVVVAVAAGVAALRPESPRTRFWNPVLRSSAPVLIAVGDVPKGPPSMSATEGADIPPSPKPGEQDPPSVPFADTVTIARVTSVLAGAGKHVLIRREGASSFSDLREGPVVLIGAFNNEWSLRLTRPLRFSLAMDAARRVIYIRDRDHPDSRQWSWSIDRHEPAASKVSSTPLHDYALISRIANSETGQVVVIIGGLYTYGTQAAGEFLVDPQLMSLARSVPLDTTRKNLQIVLETDVTEETPGPPRIVAVSSH